MFTVFECRKCGGEIYVPDLRMPERLEETAGMICPFCGEQREGLWCLLGLSDTYKGEVKVKWQEPN